ncbi:MAG: hypothetical protein H6851_00730 [Geminicoccaceae bacterium]|nr:hypothetical protein [Geminicoccaceae bacterium]
MNYGRNPSIRACAATVLLLILSGCGDFDPSLPDRPEAPSTVDADGNEVAFPRLQDVPQRPNLTYDLRQEREIQRGLVADRENARYAGQKLQREAGLRSMPPDPVVPVPAPPAQPVQDESGPATDLTAAYVRDAMLQDEDDGSLNDFLRTLEREQAAAVASPLPGAEPAIEAPRNGDAPDGGTAIIEDTSVAGLLPVGDAAGDAARNMPEIPSSSSDTPSPGEDVPPAASAPAATPPPSDTVPSAGNAGTGSKVPASPEDAAETAYADLPVVFLGTPLDDRPLPRYLTVDFSVGSSVVDSRENDALRSLAVRLQRAGQGAKVVASGDPKLLALDRARSVAMRLVQNGVPGNWIDIETGGSGEKVVVYPVANGG